MKYGISTGYSYIEVKATSVSYTYSGITTKGLVKGEIVSGNSLNGDSGGPYYIANSTGN